MARTVPPRSSSPILARFTPVLSAFTAALLAAALSPSGGGAARGAESAAGSPAGAARGAERAAEASAARPAGSQGLEECRLLRQPDIQGNLIVFVYAGDLWTVPRTGGVATRLTSHEGLERFPKFSPDGRTIAFTAEYDGNFDAFTVPATGGEPRRLTWHPDPDQVAEWDPDGKSILLRSQRASFVRRFDKFFRVPAEGGFEEPLPIPAAGFATLSPDGSRIAYVTPSYDNRTWKRYKGGMAPDIWIYDLKKNSALRITDWEGADEWPMWHQGTVYYASDRGGAKVNLWAYDVETKKHRQVTDFKDYDVKWPSIGDDAIVFEKGGYLFVMDLPSEKAQKIQVLVPDDKPGARPEYRNVAKWIGGWDISPSAKRAVIEARGEIFTVPAEKGDTRNLTKSPGSRERDPAWSPDGKWISYLSDVSGEYEIHVIAADGTGSDRQITKGGGPFRYPPRWSPDSKKLLYSDKTWTLSWVDVASGDVTRVDKSEDGDIYEYVWSGDSRFIAYTLPQVNGFDRIMLYSLDGKTATAVSSPMNEDFSPAFDPEGRWLYFISRRSFDLATLAFDLGFRASATEKVYAVSLRADLGPPTPPQSDEETGEAAKPAEGAKDDKAAAGDKAVADEKAGKGDKSAKGDKADADKKDSKGSAPAPWKIDLAGLGWRVSELPIPAGRLSGLTAFKGKLLYVALDMPNPDADGPGTGALHVFDLDKREDKTVISGIDAGYAASKDGAKVLYHATETFGIVDAAEGKKVGDGKIGAGTLMATVDPPKEWMQMFNEAWRLERDFYYDPKMGGIDWKAIGDHYRQLVPFVAQRSDLNYVIGELIGELSTSHAYVGGGEPPQVLKVDTGLLGADYDFDPKSGLYRFKTIYRERDWNSPTAAPLGEPGVDVREGDYLLAVNDRPLRAPENLYAAFVGTVDHQTKIKVGASPDDPKPRTYTVRPIASETPLRYTAWVAGNREKVAKATGGRVAYIHIPDTAMPGIMEFAKQYYPQVDKSGIIVDDRFNSGGFIPTPFVERLQRVTWAYWARRDGRDIRTPGDSIDGPKAILINQYAGSGGDCFPYFFRLAGLGPLIGKRTWGGLVGISHNLPLVDGGVVTMPDFGMWSITGKWDVENHGVDPDIEVENPPDLLAAGRDPQLERAIEYVQQQLKDHPPSRPARPQYKTRQ